VSVSRYWNMFACCYEKTGLGPDGTHSRRIWYDRHCRTWVCQLLDGDREPCTYTSSAKVAKAWLENGK
jgi:hypothetical protein